MINLCQNRNVLFWINLIHFKIATLNCHPTITWYNLSLQTSLKILKKHLKQRKSGAFSHRNTRCLPALQSTFSAHPKATWTKWSLSSGLENFCNRENKENISDQTWKWLGCSLMTDPTHATQRATENNEVLLGQGYTEKHKGSGHQ